MFVYTYVPSSHPYVYGIPFAKSYVPAILYDAGNTGDAVGVTVGVIVGVGVMEGVGVSVIVGVIVGVIDGVGVHVLVGVKEMVGVGEGVVGVGVTEGVIDGVGVGVGTYVYTNEERVGKPPEPFCCVNINLYGLILSYDGRNIKGLLFGVSRVVRGVSYP